MRKGSGLVFRLGFAAVLVFLNLGGRLAPTATAEILSREIKFKRGSSSTAVQDSVVRGDRHSYEFSANAGQTLSVSISSLENNAVFRLYVVGAYGYNDCRNEDGNVPFDCALAVDRGNDPEPDETGMDVERRNFTDSLPYGSKSGKGGTYAIVVEPTRGNATYTMYVTIK